MLDKWLEWCIFMRVSKDVPVLRLPISNYDEVRRMRNSQLVCVLRSAVLSPDKVRRFRPAPPADYDAYRVRIEVESVCIDLLTNGKPVFCCSFESAETY